MEATLADPPICIDTGIRSVKIQTGFTHFLTGMEAKWRLFLVLLLPLTACEVSIVKTIGRGPDVTEICVNTTLSNITMIVCKIRTERSGAECNLHEPTEGFEHQCDSRFSLKMENQTVFLHLMNLTAEDSGKHTCECSYPEGTYVYHLNITVEEDGEESSSTQMQIPGILIGAAVFKIIIAVTLGFLYREARQR
ncbi:hypothetical protein KUCAC02_001216 [Chaenocephalus aceratus]|uniref:Uncharacterized protein n=1 Tax=Chaenocephalus aceratus TaxID=36190 RepID=A0ACB9XX32_CHAAC|nr:hypothetical protein KUCAC02_001216 [Chaenocephalus aceratus]